MQEARHVKCDEGKPRCTRRLKGDRKCQGYATTPKQRSSDQLTIIKYVAPNSWSVSPYPQLDPRELRALQYFQTCTVPELAGSLSSELWNRFILRLAYHRSSVHHAVVALDTAHEHFSNGDLSDFSDYANREYGRAICEVIDLRESGSPAAIGIALATCVLFACLESLRGHFKSSLSHLMSGLNVLEEEQIWEGKTTTSCLHSTGDTAISILANGRAALGPRRIEHDSKHNAVHDRETHHTILLRVRVTAWYYPKLSIDMTDKLLLSTFHHQLRDSRSIDISMGLRSALSLQCERLLERWQSTTMTVSEPASSTVPHRCSGSSTSCYMAEFDP